MGKRVTKQEYAAKAAIRLRRNMTEHEKILWQYLKDNQLGIRFFPQVALHGYVVDFFCPKAKLILELDGNHHDPLRDAIRDKNLLRHRLSTLRFPNWRINQEIFQVVSEIHFAAHNKKQDLVLAKLHTRKLLSLVS